MNLIQAELEPVEEWPVQGADWTEGWPQTREAFGRLVDCFQHPLVGYAFRRLRDVQEAEDVVQDVFLRVYSRGDELRKVKCVRAYLYQVTANACTDRLRRRKRHGALFVAESDCRIETIADERPGVADQVAATEDLDRVEKLLASLPERQAEVIRMRVLDGLPFSEIAVALRCRLATVKSRLRYGLLKLRRIAKREGSS